MSLGPPGYGTSWVPSDLTEEPYALTRTYGSVRGAAGNGRPYRDYSVNVYAKGSYQNNTTPGRLAVTKGEGGTTIARRANFRTAH